MSNSILIKNYGLDVSDFEVSPFESLNMLHTRSALKKIIHELTNEERIQLYSYDMLLIQNAKKMSEHIREVYDFSLSTEPSSEWWWHLDKVAKGEISFHLSTDSESNMAM
ncbi:hypothetical protein [Bacillus sp. NPDC094106]|uniref:hypothetical protein n=1 Tax=Bacillus sp. NPDC094106 TaxID=3363949 RepID=UPI00382B2AB2